MNRPTTRATRQALRLSSAAASKALAALGIVTATLLLAGCQNQAAPPISNPFLSADRVPPPSSRIPAPGTAQPYYPGDPTPGASNSGPPPLGSPSNFGTPPTGPPPAIQANPAPSSPGYGGPSPSPGPGPAYGGTSPTAPPGGWGPPQSSASPMPAAGDRIDVPGDGLQTRVAAAGNAAQSVPESPWIATSDLGVSAPPGGGPQPFGSVSSLATAPSAAEADGQRLPPQTALAAASAAISGQTRMPIQSLLPSPRTTAAVSDGGSPISATTAGSSGVIQAGWETPSPAGPQSAGVASDQRDVILRAVGQADGFRAAGQSESVDFAFQTPHTPAARAPGEAARYAADARYQSLRGRLERQAASGPWKIRYQSATGPTDPFGGSLTIANPLVLGDLQPGEFVAVRGAIVQDGRSHPGGLPAYQITAIQRQP